MLVAGDIQHAFTDDRKQRMSHDSSVVHVEMLERRLSRGEVQATDGDNSDDGGESSRSNDQRGQGPQARSSSKPPSQQQQVPLDTVIARRKREWESKRGSSASASRSRTPTSPSSFASPHPRDQAPRRVSSSSRSMTPRGTSMDEAVIRERGAPSSPNSGQGGDGVPLWRY